VWGWGVSFDLSGQRQEATVDVADLTAGGDDTCPLTTHLLDIDRTAARYAGERWELIAGPAAHEHPFRSGDNRRRCLLGWCCYRPTSGNDQEDGYKECQRAEPGSDGPAPTFGRLSLLDSHFLVLH
jgi:hypothetical protein